MSRLNKAKNDLKKIIKRFDEMYDNEPSHENMFDIGQKAANCADTLVLEVETLQASWVSLSQKWNPDINENPTRLDMFVKEFEKILLQEKEWIFNYDEV